MQQIKLVSPRQRAFAKARIDAAPDGYLVTIREEKRRDAQNRRFWAMLHDIARAKPLGREMTADRWKLVMMHACGHACEFELGLDGKPFACGFHSSDLSVRQMADLITYMHWFGSEYHVPWSEPNPYEYAEATRQRDAEAGA